MRWAWDQGPFNRWIQDLATATDTAQEATAPLAPAAPETTDFPAASPSDRTTATPASIFLQAFAVSGRQLDAAPVAAPLTLLANFSGNRLGAVCLRLGGRNQHQACECKHDDHHESYQHLDPHC